MGTKRSNQWAAVSCVCIGLGLLVVIGALLFEAFGQPRQLDTSFAFSELKLVEPEPLHATALQGLSAEDTRRSAVLEKTPTTSDFANTSEPEAAGGNRTRIERVAPNSPTVVLFRAEPSTVPGTTPPLPATANSTTASLLSAANSTAAVGTTTDTSVTSGFSAEAEPVTEPPPGAAQGFTYCAATICNVGFKCCCSACVPYEQECDPSSCAAQSGLSVSVPCGMDLCDSGEICCDARCGACAKAGECPDEPCR